MPNRNSHANHTPQRTCVVCRAKKEAENLLSFFILAEGIVFDPQRSVQRRRTYVCPESDCLIGLDKWRRQYLKRRFRQSSAEAIFKQVAKA